MTSFTRLGLGFCIELDFRYFYFELGLTILAFLSEITGLYECILVNVCY